MKSRRSAVTSLVVALFVSTAACSGDGKAARSDGARSASSGPSKDNRPAESVNTDVPVEPAPLPPGEPGKPAGPVPELDKVKSDPDSVATAFVVTMKSMDSNIDMTWYDASMRGAPLMDQSYLRQRLGEPPRSGAGGEWIEWSKHKAYTVAVATAQPPEMGQPEDTAIIAYRRISVVVTPTGRDGWKGVPTKSTIFVTLSKSSPEAAWKVADVEESTPLRVE
jgi:hypothetical protein